MFGLLSDLDESKWMDCKDPIPADKHKMSNGPYNPWGIVKMEKHDLYLQYYLNSNAGNPNQGLLYGAHRDLLKSVGHCWMTFVEKEPGNVITGIAIEDDWVVMKPEYLATFGAPKPKQKVEPVLQRSETIDMGIYGDLVHDKWDKKGKPPRGKGKLDYHFMEVVRTSDAGNHTFDVGLGDDHGNTHSAKITCAQRNPFHSITKGYFKIVDGVIKGVMVEDDWVEMYE